MELSFCLLYFISPWIKWVSPFVFWREVTIVSKLLDGWLMNMLRSRRVKYLIVMENLCLVNIIKHKMTWYIHCCVIRFLVYWACYRAIATKPEIGTMSILVVKLMMVIKLFVACCSSTSLHIHYRFAVPLVAWGLVKRYKCESLTKTYDKNNVVYCMVWKS